MEQVRIDKWLWAARFFKTRSAATDAVLGGRVHVNGSRVKPSKEVGLEDMVEVTVETLKRTVQITGLSDQRGPARVAASLYAETPESIAAQEEHRLERRLTRPLGADLGARPTKLDRRRLDAASFPWRQRDAVCVRVALGQLARFRGGRYDAGPGALYSAHSP